MRFQSPPISPIRARHRGVTFTEVMFAVVVLGIGFIMLAAIFPVAIMQTKTSMEQTQGAALSRSALRYMEQLGALTDSSGASLLKPTTGNTVVAITNAPANNPSSFDTTALWNATSGNLIRSDDTRYAWVPLYRRDTNTPFAQVFLFAVQVRGRDSFIQAQDITPVPANLSAHSVKADLKYDTTTQTSTIDFGASNGSVGEGSFVIVAASGQIYRVGTQVAGAATAKWELAPGYDLKTDGSEDRTAADVFVVGRPLQNPAAPYDATNNVYTNIVQDVGCYTTFVRVN